MAREITANFRFTEREWAFIEKDMHRRGASSFESYVFMLLENRRHELKGRPEEDARSEG